METASALMNRVWPRQSSEPRSAKCQKFVINHLLPPAPTIATREARGNDAEVLIREVSQLPPQILR
jgi:hypothetical protein